MESRAKIFGHPIHPMLVVFPLGLFLTGVVFDIIYWASGDPHYAITSYGMLAAGLIGGVLAAIFGLVDWGGIPDGSRAKRIGLYHALINGSALAIFFASWIMRYGHSTDPSEVAMCLNFSAAAIVLVGGWLGGELVDRLGVGVDPGANVNAPNSLSGPADDDRLLPPHESL